MPRFVHISNVGHKAYPYEILCNDNMNKNRQDKTTNKIYTHTHTHSEKYYGNQTCLLASIFAVFFFPFSFCFCCFPCDEKENKENEHQ